MRDWGFATTLTVVRKWPLNPAKTVKKTSSRLVPSGSQINRSQKLIRNSN